MSTVPEPLIDPELGEQLSALMDGELDSERSRFLLRRLSTDASLRAVWERWQLASGSLRGQLALQVDAGFLERVRAGIDQGHGVEGEAAVQGPADEAAPRSGGWLRWVAGAAIAASVALAAVLGVQPRAPVAPEATLVEAPPVQPSTVALSPLSEADLRPRLRAPAQTVSAQQRGPLLSPAGAAPELDPRMPVYLILRDGQLQAASLGAFMPYVEAAEGPVAERRGEPPARPGSR
jgi:negative regulator of sigma E activity